MKERHVQDQLLLYLDGDLSEQSRRGVEEHLERCLLCRNDLHTLRVIWQVSRAHRKVEAPPYLWNRVEAALFRPSDPSLRRSFVENLSWTFRPALMALTLAAGVLIGAYLGRPGAPETAEEGALATAETENALNVSYMDNFEDLPPESVSRVYLMMASEE